MLPMRANDDEAQVDDVPDHAKHADIIGQMNELLPKLEAAGFITHMTWNKGRTMLHFGVSLPNG